MDGDASGPRPWLATLLAVLVTGAGHAYLRQWARALGWFLLTFGAVVAFVPADAVDTSLTGAPADPLVLAPAAAVVGASAVDAYLLARRARNAASADSEGPHTCPNCGHDIDPDPDLDFCPWCSAELPSAGPDDTDRTGGWR